MFTLTAEDTALLAKMGELGGGPSSFAVMGTVTLRPKRKAVGEDVEDELNARVQSRFGCYNPAKEHLRNVQRLETK